MAINVGLRSTQPNLRAHPGTLNDVGWFSAGMECVPIAKEHAMQTAVAKNVIIDNQRDERFIYGLLIVIFRNYFYTPSQKCRAGIARHRAHSKPSGP